MSFWLRKFSWCNPVTTGKRDHPFNQIQPKHLLSHAMLNLQTGIDLKEIKLLGIGVHHKFNRARRTVLHRLHQLNGNFLNIFSLFSIKMWRRRFLNHFLVTALHRAITFAQSKNLALTIAKNLYLDMAGILYKFF